MLEHTLAGNQKVRLASQYQLAAGKDEAGNPLLLRVDGEGRLLLGGGPQLPEWETFELEYWGNPETNNLKTVIYKVAGEEVARISLTYRNGGLADDDILTGGTVTLA